MGDDSHGAASDDPESGLGSLEGYFYQLDASIWAALDLILIKRRTDRVILEPASAEDLEADLDRNDPGVMVTGAQLQTVHLIVQAKLRNTGPWSATDLKSLLEHGERRPSAKARLAQNPQARYLLVTSADLAGVARDLKVGSFGLWPKALPASLGLDAADVGRVAVLSGEDPWKVEHRLREILEDHLRVPRGRFEACLVALRKAGLERMRGVGGGAFTRDHLDQIIRSHDGAISGSLELQAYVRPQNWGEIQSVLEAQHAVVLTGSSGTGKTTTADALALVLKGKTPNASVVTITGGPEHVRGDRTPEPVIFMVEDPWGKYRFEPSSRPWNDELGRLLERASANRRFIITSRSDVLKSSGAAKIPDRFVARLEADNYGPRQRATLFERRLPVLPASLQLVVDARRGRVLNVLDTPFEIQRFFDAASGRVPGDENPDQFIARCVAAAHRDMIEQTVERQVVEQEASASAAILWGLLKARPKLARGALQQIEADLGDLERDLEDKLEPLTNFFVTARNFRQDDNGISYAHPRIEAAMERVAQATPNRTRRHLGRLATVLVGLDQAGSGDWGRESAALMLQAAKAAEIPVLVSPTTQAALDAWLDEQLTAPSGDYLDRLKLAGDVGASNGPGVARWLSNISGGRVFSNEPVWEPIPDDEPWYVARAAEAATRLICARFVREVLPFHRDGYPDEFPGKLRKLAPDLQEAYRAAALKIIGAGYHSNADIIAAGALGDLDGFLEVAQAAIAFQARETAEPDAEWLKIRNRVYGDDFMEHLGQDQAEDGLTADGFLKDYVAALRAQRGWQALRDSPLVAGLLYVWIDTLRRTDHPVETEELISLAGLAKDARHEDRFWSMVASQWRPDLWPWLEARLRAGCADWMVRSEASEALALGAAGEIPALAQALEAEGRLGRLAELIVDLGTERWTGEISSERKTAQVALLASLSPSLGEALGALSTKVPPTTLSPGALSILNALPAGPNLALCHRLGAALAATGEDATAPINMILTAPLLDQDAAVEGAVWAVSELNKLGDTLRLRICLGHGFAAVRVVALQSLASHSSGPLPSALLALAADESSLVRAALLDLLQARPDRSHAPHLVRLAGDTWASSAVYYGEPVSYPLAERAAKLLMAVPDLPLGLVAETLAAARETRDEDVRDRLLDALAGPFGAPGREVLLDVALDRQRTVFGGAAARALWVNTTPLESHLADRITSEELRERSAAIAVDLSLIVGMHASYAHGIACAEAVSAHSQRRALTVALHAGASRRQDDLGRAILRLLPPELASALDEMNRSGRLVSKDLLPPGDVRIADRIFSRLKPMFEGASNAAPRGGP